MTERSEALIRVRDLRKDYGYGAFLPQGTPGPANARAVSTIDKPTSVPAFDDTVVRFMPSGVRRRRVES